MLPSVKYTVEFADMILPLHMKYSLLQLRDLNVRQPITTLLFW